MLIREVQHSDREAIVDILHASQRATGIPDPSVIPPELLEVNLYQRKALHRFVAEDAGRIIGHGLIEAANPANLDVWKIGHPNQTATRLELGGAFTDPDRLHEGVWTALLRHRLAIVRNLGAIPVSATWEDNHHVKRVFIMHGAHYSGTLLAGRGAVDLFSW